MLVEYYFLSDDGQFPNNELPVVVYKTAWKLSFLFPAAFIARKFKKNNWTNTWQNCVYGYQHYHSTAHEVLGVYKGETKLQLGGENGKVITLKKGDVIVIPAGVAHKNLTPENDFKCVGAYPSGSNYDLNYGKPGERPLTDKNIVEVPLPSKDPVLGISGPLLMKWKVSVNSLVA